MRLRHRPRIVPAGHRFERGAVLIEFATVAIFLITLLAVAFDFGMAWRSGLAVTEAVRAGARVGSAGGKVKEADRDLLLSTKAALSSSGMLDGVVLVAVFKATSSGTFPTACRTASGTTQPCHVLTGQQLRDLTATTTLQSDGCLPSTGARNRGFCPTSRNNVQLTADYIGVWVQYRYEYEFGLLGDHKTIERTAVMRLEP